MKFQISLTLLTIQIFCLGALAQPSDLDLDEIEEVAHRRLITSTYFDSSQIPTDDPLHQEILTTCQKNPQILLGKTSWGALSDGVSIGLLDLKGLLAVSENGFKGNQLTMLVENPIFFKALADCGLSQNRAKSIVLRMFIYDKLILVSSAAATGYLGVTRLPRLAMKVFQHYPRLKRAIMYSGLVAVSTRAIQQIYYNIYSNERTQQTDPVIQNSYHEPIQSAKRKSLVRCHQRMSDPTLTQHQRLGAALCYYMQVKNLDH